jgi:hypothetical protein
MAKRYRALLRGFGTDFDWWYCMYCLGQLAARLIASEGRKIAESLPAQRRAEVLQLCNEVDALTDQLSDLCKRGQVCFTGYFVSSIPLIEPLSRPPKTMW